MEDSAVSWEAASFGGGGALVVVEFVVFVDKEECDDVMTAEEKSKTRSAGSSSPRRERVFGEPRMFWMKALSLACGLGLAIGAGIPAGRPVGTAGVTAWGLELELVDADEEPGVGRPPGAT